MSRALLILLATAGLAGCTLEPNYVRPMPAVPSSWPVGDAYLKTSEAALPAVSYRDVFRDPHLQAIIDRALANNQDLRAALANIAIARAQYRVQRADLFPALDAVGGASSGSSSTQRTGHVDIAISAFELDLFGRVRSLSDAAQQQYLATEAGARATRLALVAETASAYLTLASDRSLLSIAADTETSAQHSVDLTSARLKGGVAARTDLSQAETVLEQAKSDHANLTAVVAQDRNALELLVGSTVADADLPASIESVDGLLSELPAGLDSQVLLRRPDVVQAEYQLRSSNARIGAARAAFFPDISLTAMTGFASSQLSSLFSSGNSTWSAAGTATEALFAGGANVGNLQLAHAERDLAVAQYQKAIQTAFREVSDALAQRGTITDQMAAQTALVAAANEAYVLADARYKAGADSFLDSLDSQRTLYSARRTLATTRLVRADNLVTLYRTLGGDALLDTLPPPSGGLRLP